MCLSEHVEAASRPKAHMQWTFLLRCHNSGTFATSHHLQGYLVIHLSLSSSFGGSQGSPSSSSVWLLCHFLTEALHEFDDQNRVSPTRTIPRKSAFRIWCVLTLASGTMKPPTHTPSCPAASVWTPRNSLFPGAQTGSRPALCSLGALMTSNLFV